MTAARRCPDCGAELPASTPENLCPQCLLQAGLASSSRPEPERTAAVAHGAPPSSGFIPPPPEELARRFPQLEVLELLGKGGMGAVYKARQPGLDRLVALKILPPEVAGDPSFAERFTREARALAKLNHPNIVGVYDFGQTSGEPGAAGTALATGVYYFIMEYVDGTNLRQVIQAHSLTPKDALAIVPQVCDALQFAHDEGVVHRDIKPENILLDKKGRVKIADFGLVKLMASAGHETPDVLTGTHQVMGTLRYMAPEQMEGSRDVDHRADIYSLGVVFYELLTGELPLGRFAPPSKKVQIDIRLDEIVLKTLEKEPEHRYQHASEVKSEVETVSRTPVPVRASDRAGRPRGEVFPIQTMPRDGHDILMSLALAPIIVGVFLILPGVVTFLLSTMLGAKTELAFGLAVVIALLVLFGTFVVLGSGSVASLRVDHDGLMINRYIGPSKFLPWSMVQRIEPMSIGEAFRQVWLWPGLPPRGSIICMSAQGLYRINCQGDCWYFCPRNAERFLDAIERYQRSESANDGGKEPAATSEQDDAKNMVIGPSMALMFVAFLYVVCALTIIIMGSIYGKLFTLASPAPLGGTLGVWAVVLLAAGVIIFEGARRMLQMTSYGFVFAAVIVAMVPFGLLYGLHGPFMFRYACPLLGLWALWALSRPKVRAVFNAKRTGQPIPTAPTDAANPSSGIGQISLWAAITGVVLPLLILIIGVSLSNLLRIPEAFVNLCALLGAALELVALGCGIAARDSRSGKAGIIIGGVALVPWLLLFPTFVRHNMREPQPELIVVAAPTKFDIRRDGTVTYLDGHNTVVSDVAVSGDGTSLASVDEQGFVIVRRIDDMMGKESPRVLGQFAGKGKPIHRLATTQDGRRFLATGNLKSPSIVLTPFLNGAEEQVFAPSDATIFHLFALDADALVAYATGGRVRFYDLKTRQQVRAASIYPHQGFDFSRAFVVAPDRKHFAVTSCNAVNLTSAEPCKLTIFDTEGAERFSWQFASLYDWAWAQPVFTAADTLTVCLPGGTMRRWTLTAEGKWQEADRTWPMPSGRFRAGTVSSDRKVIYLALANTAQATAADGSKYDVPAPPYHVLAVSSASGKLLWKQEVSIGPKSSQANYSAEPINSLVAVPGTNKVAAALWDGRVAIVHGDEKE